VVIHRVAQLVQLTAVVAFVAFVVLLFTNEPTLLSAPADVERAAVDETPPLDSTGTPDDDGPTDTVAPVDVAPPIDAAAIFADRCSSCHGATGAGGTGPGLSEGRAAAAFPDIEDQVTVVRDGRGRMPSFGNRLPDDELRAVVRFSRTL
jgi:mono/diheme cytochrome c family protein